MEDVGRLAGVSQVTVSRALSDPSKVSDKTLAKINAAIASTGFVPNAIAGALASQRSLLISALVPSITNVVYASAVTAFSEPMRDHGYQILLSETGLDPADEEAMILTHLSRRPDAMLLTGIHHTPKARQMLLAADIPVIEIWDITATPIDLCVGFSHAQSGRAAADFAVSRGYTHAVTLCANDERALRRKVAFVERFRATPGCSVKEIDLEAQASIEKGRQGLAAYLEAGLDHGALVFCSSDVLAHGALIEARARGISVPDELAILGFGDQDFAAHTNPPLTTVRVDKTTLGREAAMAVLARIEGEEPRQTVQDVGFEIIERGST